MSAVLRAPSTSKTRPAWLGLTHSFTLDVMSSQHMRRALRRVLSESCITIPPDDPPVVSLHTRPFVVPGNV
eukprot:1387294-Heterocapsa_arctica.AAC.1